MPYKAKKPCRFSGCPKLTNGLYCDEHRKAKNAAYNRYKRDKKSNARYGRRWKSLRDEYLKHNPLCRKCEELGVMTAAELAHHIVALADGGTDSYDNLMPLCAACHSKIHGRRGCPVGGS